jgi:hypothetical protein
MAIAIAIVVVVAIAMTALSVQLKVRQVLKAQMLHAKRVQVGAAKTVATATGIIKIQNQNLKIKLR